ncbi:hypothetical protein F7725_016805 [Dissostichus mawsoni]|uniref:V-SNARE coiled-coil homology domain-containing protein n=1 Tax=Dissostichus mawsoni TaxID=36200 RepID=A0A7J5Z2L3_DISMA|nr:hypothetical protein F7725_016805 [Dissostichus mawsoni]
MHTRNSFGRSKKFHFTMSAAGPDGAGAAPGNRRLQQTQAQVDEVVDIMRVNVDKVLERDQKLSELDDRADALQAGASQFETSAAKLKRKYWWKNCKFGITPKTTTKTTTGGGVENIMKKRRGATFIFNLSEEDNMPLLATELHSFLLAGGLRSLSWFALSVCEWVGVCVCKCA